jgi:hypothetical protein
VVICFQLWAWGAAWFNGSEQGPWSLSEARLAAGTNAYTFAAGLGPELSCYASRVTDQKFSHSTFISKIPFMYHLKAFCIPKFTYLWPWILETSKSRFLLCFQEDRREQTGGISCPDYWVDLALLKRFWTCSFVTSAIALGKLRLTFLRHFTLYKVW